MRIVLNLGKPPVTIAMETTNNILNRVSGGGGACRIELDQYRRTVMANHVLGTVETRQLAAFNIHFQKDMSGKFHPVDSVVQSHQMNVDRSMIR